MQRLSPQGQQPQSRQCACFVNGLQCRNLAAPGQEFCEIHGAVHLNYSAAIAGAVAGALALGTFFPVGPAGALIGAAAGFWVGLKTEKDRISHAQ